MDDQNYRANLGTPLFDQTVVLLGTNGNGKSTLMKCVMGMVRPTRGSVSLKINDKTHDLSGFKIQQGRLRNTWIATLMCEPVSMYDLMVAAGVSTPRTFADLMPYLRQQDTTGEVSTSTRG